MTPHELIALLKTSVAVAEGGSPLGLSRDLKAISCGMAAAFSEGVQRPPTEVPKRFINSKGKALVIGNRAGTFFHALMDLWAQGRLPAGFGMPLAESFDGLDEAVGAAVRAFGREAYTGLNGLGTVLAAEFPLDGTIAGHRRTGRVDAVREVSQEQADGWATYGIFAAEAGLYLWDYKLQAAVQEDSTEYERQIQSMAYMYLYEQQTGVRPQGFVYDLVSRAAKPTIARKLVLVPNNPNHQAILEHTILQAVRRRAEGEAVPGTACDGKYDPCPYLGVCPRYGSATQHKDIIDNYIQLNSNRFEEEAA